MFEQQRSRTTFLASLAAADIASADFSPQLSASGSGGRSRAYTGGAGPFPDTAKASSFGVALNLSWEADLWGRIRAGAEASLADVGAVEALHRGARLSLAAQTVKAYFAVVEASGQLGAADSGVPEELRGELDACQRELEPLDGTEVGGLGGDLAD